MKGTFFLAVIFFSWSLSAAAEMVYRGEQTLWQDTVWEGEILIDGVLTVAPEVVLEIQRGGGLTEILEDLERQLIVQTLRREKGSQTRTAEVLGIKRTTLRYKMEKYGLLERTE